MIKKNSEDLKGQALCTLNVKTAQGSCRLALGFDDSIIEQMKLVTSVGAQFKTEKIMESALNVIFKITKKIFLKNTGDVPVLEESQFILDKTQLNYHDLKKPKGVVIPIKTQHGYIYAQALYIKSATDLAA